MVTSGSENHVTLKPRFTSSGRLSNAMACTIGGPMHRIDAIDQWNGHRSKSAKCTRLNCLQGRETVHKVTDCCRARRTVRQKGSSNLRSFCWGLMAGLNKPSRRHRPPKVFQTIFTPPELIESRTLRKLLIPYSPKETFRHRIARTSGALPFDHVNESFFINGGGSCRNVEFRG